MRRFATIAFLCLGAAAPAYANPTCAQLQGVWSGRQTDAGGASREITLTFRNNCTYTWVSPRTNTEGQITMAGGGMTYRNAAGSVGDVTGSASRLTFKHMRGNYTVAISKRR